MRGCTLFNTALLLLVIGLPTARAQTTLHWDIDGITVGAGGTSPAGIWDQGTTSNWNTDPLGGAAGAISTWTAGDVAVFSAGTTTTGAFNITLSGTQTASGVTFEEGTVTLLGDGLDLSGTGVIDVVGTRTGSINSVIGGSVGLTKTGTGRLTLSGVNTYSGATTINGGILQFTKTNSMPLSGDVTVNSGATLAVNAGGSGEWTDLTSGGGSIGGLIAGTGGQGTANQVAWTSGSSLGIDTTNAGGSLTYSGNIGSFRTATGTTDDVGLTKLGGGMLELTDANTYTGTTTIGIGVNATNRSVLRIASSSAITANSVIHFGTSPGISPQNRLEIAPSVNVTVSAITGGAVNSGGTFNDASIIDVGFGTLTFNIAEGVTNTINPYVTADLDVLNDVRGKVIKNGPGTLTMLRNNGNVDFSGEFILNEGTVSLVQGQTFGAVGDNSKLTINGGKLAYAAASGNLTMQVRHIDIVGDFALENITNGAVTQFLGSEGSTIITLKDDNPTITVNTPSGANFNFTGKVVDDGTPRGFTKDGPGLLTLQHKYNSYRGDTTILAGRLSLGFGSNIVDPEHEGINASPGNLGGPDNEGNYGTLHLSGGAFNISRTRSLNPTDNEFVNNPVNVTADSAITSNSNQSTFAGAPATVNFSSNDIGGSAGTLTLRNDATAGANPAHRFDPYFSGSDFDFPRPINFEDGLNPNRPTRLNSANTSGTQTFSGAITGPGSYRRTILPGDSPGTGGTTVFTGANTYSLGTFIDDGTLVVQGAVATLGTGDVTVTGGVVEIASGVTNAIANAATLSISGTGIVNLGTGINEFLAGLTLGGMMQATGTTYGSTASSAMVQNDVYFTGTGILTVAPPIFAGDYNDDGTVDAADYVVWRHAGATDTIPNDTTAGMVGPEDYDEWVQNFGEAEAGSGGGSSALSGNGAVPEPGTFAAAIVGLLLAGACRRRQA